jgi:hypothetical protein
MFVQYIRGIIHLAATFTAQVAAKERLKHQHQRKTLMVHQHLADDILPDTGLLENWYSH